MRLRTLKDFDFKDKKVLVRAGFDCPMDKKGNILDDSRIREVIPTLKYLTDKGAIVIVISHNGRPEGKVIPELSMAKTAQLLAKLMKKPIAKLDDCIGNEIEHYIDEMIPGEIVVLENLRFYNEEKNNDADFAKSLAELADIFVNESFPTCHNEDASMVSIPKFIPGCIGIALEKELDAMLDAVKNPKKPYIAIIGGKKADKIKSVESIMKKATAIFVVGVLANTFLKAKGFEIGKSLYDKESISKAKALAKSKKIVLPIDFVVKDGSKIRGIRKVDYDKVSGAMEIMDLGPKTLKRYSPIILKAKTVLWAGPPGMFEDKRFAKGTLELGKMLAKSKADTIVGGGDTGEAVHKFKLDSKMAHVSTGGGATLALFEGKTLPGLKALEENFKKFS